MPLIIRVSVLLRHARAKPEGLHLLKGPHPGMDHVYSAQLLREFVAVVTSIMSSLLIADCVH